jgi:hypothetical protein
MTPNDLNDYLRVFDQHAIGAAMLKLPDGTELHFTVIPKFPERVGEEPTPGGWKSPQHLDDPAALREDYRGELP